jgi:hypothetical protein
MELERAANNCAKSLKQKACMSCLLVCRAPRHSCVL